jgi:hypothetical protein
MWSRLHDLIPEFAGKSHHGAVVSIHSQGIHTAMIPFYEICNPVTE